LARRRGSHRTGDFFDKEDLVLYASWYIILYRSSKERSPALPVVAADGDGIRRQRTSAANRW
jgi:hypothetical protein